MKRLERMCVLVMAGAMAVGASAQGGARVAGHRRERRLGRRILFMRRARCRSRRRRSTRSRTGTISRRSRRGWRSSCKEMEAIANNPAAPTFENTIVAMEKTGQLLNRVSLVFNGVTQANTNDTLQKVQDIETPKLAALQDAIYLNTKLFARVQKVYDERATLKLDPESLRLVEVDYRAVCEGGGEADRCGQGEAEEVERRRGGAVEHVYEQAAGGDQGGGVTRRRTRRSWRG